MKKNRFNQTDYSNGKFTDYTEVEIKKIIQKIQKKYLLALSGKGLHFCITEMGIRPNCSDYLFS